MGWLLHQWAGIAVLHQYRLYRQQPLLFLLTDQVYLTSFCNLLYVYLFGTYRLNSTLKLREFHSPLRHIEYHRRLNGHTIYAMEKPYY